MKKLLYLMAVVALVLASCSKSTEKKVDAPQETTEVQAEAPAEEAAAKGKPTVLDFNATWCGPCRQFAPLFEKFEETYGEAADFKSIDVDENPELAQQFEVEAIPTVVALDSDGKETWRSVGIPDVDDFEQAIHAVIN